MSLLWLVGLGLFLLYLLLVGAILRRKFTDERRKEQRELSARKEPDMGKRKPAP